MLDTLDDMVRRSRKPLQTLPSLREQGFKATVSSHFQELESLGETLGLLREALDIDQSREELEQLSEEFANPRLYEDAQKTREFTQKHDKLRQRVEGYDALHKKFTEARVMLQMISAERDDDELRGFIKAIDGLSDSINPLVEEAVLNGEYDRHGAVVTLRSGMGDKEAHDLTENLLQMYTKWGEKQGHPVELLDRVDGDGNGVRSASIIVDAENAYGLLAAEQGWHRMVRQSPYGRKQRRTSFANVTVLPLLDDVEDVVLKEDELQIDTFRSTGAGGQSVNTTDSAVRITHTPSGLSAASQNQKSQLQNRQMAMRVLHSRVQQTADEGRAEELDELRGEKEPSKGNSLRSYVLDKSRVTDYRTGVESTDPERVFNGDLEPFIQKALYLRSTERGEPYTAQAAQMRGRVASHDGEGRGRAI